MSDDSLTHLPGSEIVLPGIADLKAGRHTVNASAVQSAAPYGGLVSGSTIFSHVERNGNTAAEAAEAVRVKRIREDARRPISVNLAETIALSHALLKMADAAKRQ